MINGPSRAVNDVQIQSKTVLRLTQHGLVFIHTLSQLSAVQHRLEDDLQMESAADPDDEGQSNALQRDHLPIDLAHLEYPSSNKCYISCLHRHLLNVYTLPVSNGAVLMLIFPGISPYPAMPRI